MADTKEKKTLIRFTEPWGNHTAGETAGFSEQQAKHLVKHGVAVLDKDAKKEKADNEKADSKQRADDKKAAIPRAKDAEASAKKKVADEKKAADKAAKEAAATE